MMDLYLNAGFGRPLGMAMLAQIEEYGFDGVRQDVPSAARAEDLLPELAAFAPMKSVLLLSKDEDTGVWCFTNPEAVYTITEGAVDIGIAKRSAVEMGNELDDKWKPLEYAEAFIEAYHAVRRASAHMPVITAGIRATRRECIAWVGQVTATPGFPEDAVIGYHTYRDGDPAEPNRGYSSRMAEFADLEEAARGRVLFNTEIGWEDQSRSRAEVAGYLIMEAVFNREAKAAAMTVYQLNDAEGGKDAAFGLRDRSGQWKEQARALRSAIGSGLLERGTIGEWRHPRPEVEDGVTAQAGAGERGSGGGAVHRR